MNRAATHVVSVTAGAGPVEARRFVRELGARMKTLCAAAGLTILAISEDEVDGAPRSVDLTVAGDAPAALAAELGTHALVARSGSRGRASRKRWFARVVVRVAVVAPTVAPSIDRDDLEVRATRAGGPGGQHVNRVATAVRVRHVASGLAVRVADERSQRANVRIAVERLASALAERGAAERRRGAAALRAEKLRVERGAAVRTYRLGRRGELEIIDRASGDAARAP